MLPLGERARKGRIVELGRLRGQKSMGYCFTCRSLMGAVSIGSVLLVSFEVVLFVGVVDIGIV